MTAPQSKHVVVFGTDPKSLVNFRTPLIKAFLEMGHRVSVISLPAPAQMIQPLLDLGVAYHPFEIERAGLNPVKDFGAVLRLRRLLRQLRPDVVFGSTIKPVIYGMSVARWLGIRRRAGMMAGLGYAFTDGPNRWAVRTIASWLLWFGARQSHIMLFQNPDDRQKLVDLGVISRGTPTGIVNGSGVDLGKFAPAPMPGGPTTFLMIARLLKDKGLFEFVEAARQVKARFPEARFVLVGGFDPNPAAVQRPQIEAWVAEGVIEYHGEVSDVRPAIAASHVNVLPSYREGTPRTVLEAMAMRRPVITTDAPGCRQTIEDGVSGYLVPPREAGPLAERMIRFLETPSLIERMAAESLTRAQEKYEAMAVGRATARLVLGP